MPIVSVYKFRANFRAVDPLRPDRSLEGLLLLRQETDARDDDAAVAACTGFHAFDAVIERYTVLDVAALAKPQNRDFVALHAKALNEGSALAYYDNAAPSQGSPSQ
jgi:hypothetical protein